MIWDYKTYTYTKLNKSLRTLRKQFNIVSVVTVNDIFQSVLWPALESPGDGLIKYSGSSVPL